MVVAELPTNRTLGRDTQQALVFTRIISVVLAPVRNEIREAVVDLLWHDDLQANQLICGLTCRRVMYALAAKPQCLDRACAFWNSNVHPAADGVDLDL